jgi:hypothetical protein
MRADKRTGRLQNTVLAAGWWLGVQGLTYLLLGDRSAGWLHLRYNEKFAGLFNSTGVALLCLGLFVNRSVREARRQYLAIDTLALFFLLRSALAFGQALRGVSLTWMDWFALLMDLGLAGCLVFYRTRSAEMAAPGTVVAYDFMEAARDLKRWLQGKRPAFPRQLGELHPPGPAGTPGPVPAETKAAPPDGKHSEALPHMD